ELTHAVAYLISKDMMPLVEIVEKPGFLHLMKKAVPQYKIRSYFSTNEIPRMYKEVKASVEKQLEEGEWFRVTTDLWTSGGAGGEPYMSFMVHYVSSDWQLKSHCLETLYFPDDHTADNITKMVENMLQEWKIRITTDNATNMKKAFKNFLCVWFSCFGHNLNLASPHDTKGGICHLSIVTPDPGVFEKLEEIPVHSLMHDVVTRWGSTFEMISRFLEQQQAICGVLAGDRSTWHLMPKDNDISVLEDANQLLSPLHDFTDALTSEKLVTLSLKPVLEHINSEIFRDQEGDSTLTKQMKQIIKEDIHTEEMKRVLNISGFVDPQFKGNFAEHLDDSVKACVDEAMALVPGEPPHTEHPPPATTQGDDNGERERRNRSPSITKKKRSRLSGLLQQITNARPNRTASANPLTKRKNTVDPQVKLHLSLPAISADADPFAHMQEMPHLFKVARTFTCIPATSVPYRVFSMSGHIESHQRSRLSTENVNILTFLHHN
uniref:HAT C-terminal dimerisation domain-containing protein n=1 Tax=Lepisosteus oculatus TaxID=7918 RepID=W5N327_LEPOC